jgi:hypothetical protein
MNLSGIYDACKREEKIKFMLKKNCAGLMGKTRMKRNEMC